MDSDISQVVAVIGLGNIGGGVSQNLAAAGFQVWGADLDEALVSALAAKGGLAAGSASAAVENADVVFTSLPGPKQILSVATEILPVMKAGSIWVELSTNDLETAAELLRLCDEVGVRLIDAPVSGGPEGASAGTLSIFAGGADADIIEVMPLLEVIGSKVRHLGGNGTGVVAKIAQVTLCYTQTVALTEALLLGVKGGIEPAKMLDLIQTSAGSSYVADSYGPEIVAGTYDASFPISHAAKDMRLAMELAASLGATLPFMGGVAKLYQQTEALYGPTAAHLLAAQLIERDNDELLHETQAELITRQDRKTSD